MSEQRLVIKERVLKFEGLFNLKEFWGIVFSHFMQRDYDPVGDKDEIQHREKTRMYHTRYNFLRELTDNESLVTAVELIVDIEKDVKVKDQTLQKGKLTLNFKGYLRTDDDDIWDGTDDKHKGKQSGGLWLMIRHLGSFYVFKNQNSAAIRRNQKDIDDLYAELLTYINGVTYK